MFPDWLAQHQKLQRLGLSKNSIINLPDLSAMKALTDLDLQSNQIDRFPWELFESQEIKLILLKDNHFRLTQAERSELMSMEKQFQLQGITLVY